MMMLMMMMMMMMMMIAFISFDGVEDGEHSGDGFGEVSIIFAIQDDFQKLTWYRLTDCKCFVLVLSSRNSMPCVFPFQHNHKVYYNCTTEGGHEGIPWCATGNIADDDPSTPDDWGYCLLNGELKLGLKFFYFTVKLT